ncbi:glycosyltransferase family 2 protein [Pedobacter kyungheensis]|uniref:glycosyltransferase family 2 protein n=1 Tax=Pedobacter kyungheensis TaxID=1069985 RepID=UPI0006902486|nr:glycosyltransferase family 2 protein [Pedobacter kyungheensis]
MKNLITENNGLLNELPQNTNLKAWPWDKEVDPKIYSIKKDWPKISIVTPSYNQGVYLEQTIRSILLQNYPNLEYIIIDGGSTDNSKEIIEKYSQFINYWISEKDNGQANAINKGLHLISGDLFNWINSDDFLEYGALFELGICFKGTDQIIAGSVNNFKEVDDSKNVDDSYYGLIKNTGLNIDNYFAQNGSFNFHQPGVWLGRALIQNQAIDEHLHFGFDAKFILSILENYPLVNYTASILVNFRLHELSKTLKDQAKFGEEIYKIYQYYIEHGNLKISRLAKTGLDRMSWMAHINAIASSLYPKQQKIGLIIKGIWEKPTKRLNRFSLGCIKDILIS